MGKGIALKVAATLAFSIMNALIKAASARFPVAEVVLFRSLFAILVLLVWLWRRGELPESLKTRRPFGHVGRSIAGSGGMFASFVVLSLLPLADATAFTFVTPLLVVPLAATLLGEVVRPYRWAAVALGFGGVLAMLSDRLGGGVESPNASLGVTVALAGALSSAVAMIQTRRLTLSEPTGAIVFYFSSVTSVLSAALLVVFALWPAGSPGGAFAASQGFVAFDGRGFLALAAIGVLGGVGQILMTHSYRFADASIIAAFDYVAMIWAAALGLAFFGEAPTPRVVLGAVVVAGAGLFVVWRERARRRIAVAV
jgi:drug/metabolite transporter (DMT)-like permease